MNKTLIHEFITRQVDLLRYEKNVREDVFALLDVMQTHIQTQLFSGSLNAQIEQIENIVKNGYISILKMLDVLPVLDTEMMWLAATLGGLATAYKLKDKIIPFAQKKLKDSADKFTVGGLTLPETIAKQRNDLTTKIKAWLRQAQIDNITPDLSELGDLFSHAKNTAKTMTRTWINSVAHTAHDAFAKINPFVKGFRHLSVLDGATTAVCTHRNGLLWDKKHQPIGHNEIFRRPPLHYNCRSKLVYVYDLKEPFDGYSGEDWIQSRSLSQLQEQFGKGIGQMLFDDKIKLSDALDGVEPLTLAKLQEKVDWQRFIWANETKTYTLGNREFSALDLAKLSGAVDGSEIVIVKRINHFLYNSPVLEIFAEHEIYDSRLHRLIRIDKDGNLILHNETQFLRKEYQKQGIATQSLENQINTAKSLGVEYIETYALRSESSNGYYTWARLGFDGKLPPDFFEKLPDELSDMKTISALMGTEQGRQWWYHHGGSVNMKFDLRDNGYSIKIFKEYLKSNRKKNNNENP